MRQHLIISQTKEDRNSIKMKIKRKEIQRNILNREIKILKDQIK